MTPDEQDKALGATGDNSIYQKIRLLTPQQREVLDGLLAGMSPKDACARAGYKSAHTGMNALKSKVPDIMDRLGLTDEALVAKYLMPLLEATETKFFQKDGIVCDQRTVEASDIRRQTLDMAFKLRGSYRDAEEDEDARDITVNIVSIGAQR